MTLRVIMLSVCIVTVVYVYLFIVICYYTHFDVMFVYNEVI